MHKRDYVNAMAEIKATSSLKRRIASKIQQTQRDSVNVRRPHGWPVKRAVAICCATVVCIFSTLAYAGVIDWVGIYRGVFGDNAAHVEPYITPIMGEATRTTRSTVESNQTQVPIVAEADANVIESTYDGIVIKLLSAINDDNALRIFATVTDTTGDRIGENTRFDYWGLEQGYGGNISIVDYNRDTRTATLLITSMGDHAPGAASLWIDGFVGDRRFIQNHTQSSIDLYDALQKQTAVTLSRDDVYVIGGATQSGEQQQLRDATDVLAMDALSVALDGVDWCVITNVGFVDGRLHIQTRTLSDNQNDLASMDVTDARGAVHQGHLQIGYVAPEHGYAENNRSPYPIYKEMIYPDITDLEQLKGASVSIDYLHQGQTYDGEWRFSFEIPEKALVSINVYKDVNINGKDVYVDTVSLSPLGVTLHLNENITTDYDFDKADIASVTYEDGVVVPLTLRIDGYEDTSTLTFGGVIEMERVRGITINGRTLTVHDFE